MCLRKQTLPISCTHLHSSSIHLTTWNLAIHGQDELFISLCQQSILNNTNTHAKTHTHTRTHARTRTHTHTHTANNDQNLKKHTTKTCNAHEITEEKHQLRSYTPAALQHKMPWDYMYSRCRGQRSTKCMYTKSQIAPYPLQRHTWNKLANVQPAGKTIANHMTLHNENLQPHQG